MHIALSLRFVCVLLHDYCNFCFQITNIIRSYEQALEDLPEHY